MIFFYRGIARPRVKNADARELRSDYFLALLLVMTKVPTQPPKFSTAQNNSSLKQ
jgi:hypothetical protein